jgi:SHS2 domain-containing protein
LLYDFLEEIIYLLDAEQFLIHDVKELKINNKNELTCILVGDKQEGYEVFTHVKAMTYNDMIIKEEEGKTTLQVVVDH